MDGDDVPEPVLRGRSYEAVVLRKPGVCLGVVGYRESPQTEERKWRTDKRARWRAGGCRVAGLVLRRQWFD